MKDVDRTTRDVWAYVSENPGASVREIQRACGISSTSQVVYHIKRCGYIERIQYEGPQTNTANRTLVVSVPLFRVITAAADGAGATPSATAP